MNELLSLILPEIVLITVACGLFLVGVSNRAASRRLAPVLALVALIIVFAWQVVLALEGAYPQAVTDPWKTVNVGRFALYVRLLTSGVGIVLVLLAWPTNRDATGSASMNFGADSGEFFALMLLSIAGVFLVAVANDIILLFLAVELASIPTYVMVSISRPLPAAQEAGVKYFFLGAMAAAVMLFGFSYLYGTTGKTKLDEITLSIDATRLTRSGAAVERAAAQPAARLPARAQPAATQPAIAPADPAADGGGDDPGSGRFWEGWPPPRLSAWHMVAVVMLLAGLAFKIAAVPMHAYAGDVYQGAATPVTAFLAFVPKTSGFVAILKVLSAVGGHAWSQPDWLVTLLWVVAAFTMTVGNVLAMVQPSNGNVKRVLAYSSVAHSGYMLVGITALVQAARAIDPAASPFADISRARDVQAQAMAGVLFYLAAYGVMNAGAFGVLMLLPSRVTAYAYGGSATGGGLAARSPRRLPPPATTAETFEDLAGQGRRHPLLGLAMAVCCFSLIGLPLTVGFVGKFYLIKPALSAGLIWLVVITLVNAAVSAVYYLRIIATMFLRPAPETATDEDEDAHLDAAADADRPTADAASASPARDQTAGVGIRYQPAAAGRRPARWPWPIATAVGLSSVGTLLLGAVFPATTAVTEHAAAARIDPQPQVLSPPVHRDSGDAAADAE